MGFFHPLPSIAPMGQLSTHVPHWVHRSSPAGLPGGNGQSVIIVVTFTRGLTRA